MIVPSGTNFLNFYESAQKKGIRITSRYTGVYFNKNGKAPSWMAKCHVKGKEKFLGRFPFTEVGEKKAAESYENYMRGLNLPIAEKKKYFKPKK